MTDWTIKLPYRAGDSITDMLDNRRELADAEDRDVLLEIGIAAAEAGIDRAEHVAWAFEEMTPQERRWALDRLRERAGLRSATGAAADAERELARSAALARDAERSRLQVCHAPGCKSIPVDPVSGLQAEVNVRRWFCERHRDQAQEGDLDQRPVYARFGRGGQWGLVDEDDELAAQAREQAAERSRERRRAERERERSSDFAEASEIQRSQDEAFVREVEASLGMGR